MIEGFKTERIPTAGAEINLRHGGPVGVAEGPAVLMIHGYPQSHIIWRHLAPRLAATYTVVCPDLRGYGDSSRPAPDPEHKEYSKRIMGEDLLQVMAALGHETFAVVGHDRGGRVAYRMALDFPERITRLCTLDIVPTGSVWSRANKAWAMGAFHWPFLAQPAPKPEVMIGHDPDHFLLWLIESWSASMRAFEPQVLDEYKRHFRDPDVIRATCEDYRAGATIDDELDQADLAAGHRIGCPVLALWGAVRSVGGPKGDGAATPLDIWKEWADDVRGGPVESGHFLPEEAPDAVWEHLVPFLAGGGE